MVSVIALGATSDCVDVYVCMFVSPLRSRETVGAAGVGRVRRSRSRLNFRLVRERASRTSVDPGAGRRGSSRARDPDQNVCHTFTT